MDTGTHPDLADALNQLWLRHLSENLVRISILETAAAACTGGVLSHEQREAAISAAHKLAGVLGSFDLKEGTELARELEALYSKGNGPDAAAGPQLASLAAKLRFLAENRE